MKPMAAPGSTAWLSASPTRLIRRTTRSTPTGRNRDRARSMPLGPAHESEFDKRLDKRSIGIHHDAPPTDLSAIVPCLGCLSCLEQMFGAQDLGSLPQAMGSRDIRSVSGKFSRT